MIIDFKIFENVDEPINIGEKLVIYLDVPKPAGVLRRDVWQYKNINFSWNENELVYILVTIYKEMTETSENEKTYDYARSVVSVNMGENLEQAKHKIDKYYFDVEVNKYNL